jgi:hypothetical protein
MNTTKTMAGPRSRNTSSNHPIDEFLIVSAKLQEDKSHSLLKNNCALVIYPLVNEHGY